MFANTDRIITALGEAARGLPGMSDDVCALLGELAECGEPVAALGVLPLIWHPDSHRKTGDDAASEAKRPLALFWHKPRPALAPAVPEAVERVALETVIRLMASLRPEDLAAFDVVAREASSAPWRIGAAWQGWLVRPVPDPANVPKGPARIALLGVLASHANGHIREAAVKELDGSALDDALPFLLWRTADWVTQVRERAVAAVRRRLQTRNAAPFVKALPLLPRLEALGRVDLSGLVAEIRTLVLDEPGLVSLMDALRVGSRSLKREVCRTLDLLDSAPPFEAALIAARDPDVVLRQWALRWVERLRAVDSMDAETIRRSLRNDPVPGIRVGAFRSIVAADEDACIPELQEALTDVSGTVRECARYHLRRLRGQMDFAAHYRRAIEARDDRLAAAVAGLGETGKPSDLALIVPFLSGRSRLAQTALKAMARLDEEATRIHVLDALIDPKPGMRRVALRLLGDRVSEAEFAAIKEQWSRSRDPGAWEALTKATLRLPPWPALEVFLFAAGLDFAHDAAVEGLSRWRPEQYANYAPVPPPVGMRMRLRNAVLANPSRLSENLTLRLLKALD